MLAIVSDLHLNDGSTGALLDAGAMDLFADRLADLAYRASWRADGSYHPIERIDLVLLGDVLDIVGSQRWLASPMRPWSDLTSPAGSDLVAAIVDDILRKNLESLRRLRSLATEGVISVPFANQHMQPVMGEEELPVAVCTHYMVGNHDWPLHLRSQAYDMIRHKVCHHLGLSTSHNRPFPHEAAESDELHDALRRHRVLARHGDIFDPLAFSEDRDSSSLSDVITIEMLGRFLMRLESELGSDLPEAAAIALQEVTQIRPILMVPAWMDSLLERTIPSLALRKGIKRMWDEVADELLSLAIVQQPSLCSVSDLIDGLAGALKFSKRDSTDWTGKTLRWLASLRGAKSDSYLLHAMAEPDFRNRRARHMVYGHTHTHEITPLDASHADGYVLSQTYFNAGTWRKVYRPTQALGQQEFAAAESISLLSFYQEDERGGRPYETWSGTLAPASVFAAVAPEPPPAANRHAIRAPHFARSQASVRTPSSRHSY